MNSQQRNYGYGKKLSYAIRSVIVELFGEYCQGTQATYRNRVKHLIAHFEAMGIRDLREVDQAETDGFAEAVCEKY